MLMQNEIPREGVEIRTERRRSRRYVLHCPCWLEREKETIFGTTADIGLGGLFVTTAIPMEPGVKVEVRLN